MSVEAEPGSLIAVEGPSGSGRTCLLLALTGRMKITEGTATVGDAGLPKQMSAVRRVSALAHVPGVTDLEPALTVGEHLRERALLQRRFGDSLRGLLRPRGERAAEAGLRVDTALAAAGLDLEALPKGPRTAVRDLERLEALRLSVALALEPGRGCSGSTTPTSSSRTASGTRSGPCSGPSPTPGRRSWRRHEAPERRRKVSTRQSTPQDTHQSEDKEKADARRRDWPRLSSAASAGGSCRAPHWSRCWCCRCCTARCICGRSGTRTAGWTVSPWRS
ncbi:hypothetical protein SPURM210S_05169 [Streptomyces purpurascens]